MYSPKLGDQVACDITGFIGFIVGMGEFLDEGHQVLVRCANNEPGKYAESVWLKPGRVTPTGKKLK